MDQQKERKKKKRGSPKKKEPVKSDNADRQWRNAPPISKRGKKKVPERGEGHVRRKKKRANRYGSTKKTWEAHIYPK